jgi:hypothetical protein
VKPQQSKSMFESLPRDTSRQAVLKALLASRDPIRTRELVGRAQAVDPSVHLDAKAASELVQSAIREGLVDIAGQGDDLRIQLTPFGSDVAKNID